MIPTTPVHTLGGSGGPRVSIGLPVRNGEPYLKEAIEALLSQTFSDFELIICDNDSTDGTAEIALGFVETDSRVRYQRNDRDLGLARNFNKAFDLSEGAYFKWAACDDIHLPEYLTRCVQALEEGPGIVLAYPKASEIDEEGNVLNHCLNPFQNSCSSALRRVHHLIWNEQRNPHMQFGLMRREVLGKTGLIRPELGSDWVLLAELALMGPWHQIDETLFVTRRTVSRRDGRTRSFLDPSLRGRSLFWRPWVKYHQARAVVVAALPVPQKIVLFADIAVCHLIRDAVPFVIRQAYWTVRHRIPGALSRLGGSSVRQSR